MATRMRFCFDFLFGLCILLHVSYHLKMKFIVHTCRGTSSFLSISDNIGSYTCIEHYTTCAVELCLVRAKCLDKNKRQITRNLSRPNYAILYFNVRNCNVRNIRGKMPWVVREGKPSEINRKFTHRLGLKSRYRDKID